MDTPRFVTKSLDLIPQDEQKSVVRSLDLLEQFEREPGRVRLEAARAIRPKTFILKASKSYRIVYELHEGKVRIIDLVHRDRIGLAIRKHGKPR